MCMYESCDEMVNLLGEATHKARKQHRCAECRRSIEPGETYHVDRYIFEGKLTHHKTCAHCMVVRGWLQDECGGWVYTGVEEDIREHAESGHYGFGVGRLAVGIRLNWRRKDGRLMPLPHMPKTTHEQQGGAS